MVYFVTERNRRKSFDFVFHRVAVAIERFDYNFFRSFDLAAAPRNTQTPFRSDLTAGSANDNWIDEFVDRFAVHAHHAYAL